MSENLKGLFDFRTMVGFFLVFIIYLVGFRQPIQDQINTALPTLSATEAGIISFVPAVFLIAIIISIFKYAFSSSSSGGEYY